MDDRPQPLAHLEYLGDATQFSAQLHALIPRSALLEHFTAAEVRLLAHFMDVHRAAAGSEILREGDGGDFMLMLIEGRVEVAKRDRAGRPRAIAVVEAGETLGEMSMIDGEPRFASCVALEPALVAALDRDSLARIVVEQPMLGAKILMELVLMLSHRLRVTSQRLLETIEEWDRDLPGPL
jgi:CRP/FNR family transcriptional regulator, cyclic AMP receptor protein